MGTGPSIHDYKFVYHKVGGQDVHFEPSDEDTTGATYQYYGFLSSSGSWLILRFDLTVTDVINYRYAVGQSAYSTAWTARDTHTYNYFNDISPV